MYNERIHLTCTLANLMLIVLTGRRALLLHLIFFGGREDQPTIRF